MMAHLFHVDLSPVSKSTLIRFTKDRVERFVENMAWVVVRESIGYDIFHSQQRVVSEASCSQVYRTVD